ncbi:MAG TPA: hypothetical protein VGP93_08455 [Polyangiaceae bacterium]|jgi:hypothetical protein|nr:hypothetical protein [Polyangiaceae bacterium]
MQPEHGGRVELRLVDADESQARYEVLLFDPAARWATEAAVRGEQVLELGAWSGPAEPPTWLQALARTLLRGTARQHHAAGSWPRRLTRWRPGPGHEE